MLCYTCQLKMDGRTFLFSHFLLKSTVNDCLYSSFSFVQCFTCSLNFSSFSVCSLWFFCSCSSSFWCFIASCRNRDKGNKVWAFSRCLNPQILKWNMLTFRKKLSKLKDNNGVMTLNVKQTASATCGTLCTLLTHILFYSSECNMPLLIQIMQLLLFNVF